MTSMRNTAEMPLTQVIFILSSSGDEVELILLLLASFFLITLILNQIAGYCKHCATLGAYQILGWLKTKAHVWVNKKRRAFIK